MRVETSTGSTSMTATRQRASATRRPTSSARLGRDRSRPLPAVEPPEQGEQRRPPPPGRGPAPPPRGSAVSSSRVLARRHGAGRPARSPGVICQIRFMTSRRVDEDSVHRDRPTQVAKIDSRISRPSEHPAPARARSRGRSPRRRRRRRPAPTATSTRAARASPSGRPPRSARGRSRAGRGWRRKRSCWVPSGPSSQATRYRPARRVSGTSIADGRPAVARASLLERDGRQRPAARRRPGGVEPDVGDLLARVDDPARPLAGRDGVGRTRSAAPSRGRPRGPPARSSARSASRCPARSAVVVQSRTRPSPTTRSITAGDRAGSFQRASTRTCSRVSRPARRRAMIWRTATRSSAEGFSSSSFSSGDGRTGSTIRPRIASSTRAFSGSGRSRLVRRGRAGRCRGRRRASPR